MSDLFSGIIKTNVDTTAHTLTTESLTEAFRILQERTWEPHRHLFNPRATKVDGIHACVECGAPVEWRNGQPILDPDAPTPSG